MALLHKNTRSRFIFIYPIFIWGLTKPNKTPTSPPLSTNPPTPTVSNVRFTKNGFFPSNFLRSAGSQGSDAVLNNDLVHLLWLPLSELRSSDCLLDWVGVFTLTLQLASALVRQAGQRALDTSISFVALLQDQLTSFLLRYFLMLLIQNSIQ